MQLLTKEITNKLPFLYTQEAPLVMKMFELRAKKTMTDEEIIEEINKMGYKSRINLLRDPKDKTMQIEGKLYLVRKMAESQYIKINRRNGGLKNALKTQITHSRDMFFVRPAVTHYMVVPQEGETEHVILLTIAIKEITILELQLKLLNKPLKTL